jgi:hypothetical protein
MKRLWVCDFCNHTEIEDIKMIAHEKGCRFNPKLKSCSSCKHDNIMDSICNKDFFDDDRFNCQLWKTNNIKIIRKLKLDKLNDTSMEM